MYREIGSVVKRLREERGMSLEDLAGAMQYPKGGDPSGLQRLEAGSKRVYMDLYEQIAAAFNISLWELVREAEGAGDPCSKVLSQREEETIHSYLTLSDSAKGALEYIIAATSAGDQKTGSGSND
ncbi:MAG: helix-turn-helix transcriptional regulator [Dechloromonas sp.]|nr:helix-turn-helix transcriptional regulator [Dechloromonas sp.]